MKQKLLHGFLYIVATLMASHSFAISTSTTIAIAKDTVLTDSTQLKKVSTTYLKELQQRLKHSTLLNTPLKPAVSTQKNYRAFPEIDKQLAENKNFKFGFTNNSPEFTDEYIAANFTKNPAVDTLKAQAERAFAAVKKLGNFVDIITGKELLELPVGLKKTDQTSGNSVELAISEVTFTPGYALLKVWARLTIPEKGEIKDDKKRGTERELFFGAENVKLSHDGGLTGDMKLVLLGDQAIPLNGDNWLLTLKGGIDLKKGTFNEQSYIEFDCSGLKSIGLEADLRISRNILLPITSEGNYTCSENKDTKSLNDSDVVNNKCYVGTSFSVKASGWNDLLVEVSLPQFEIRGLKGWGFNIKNAILDLSDSRNASTIKLPKEYNNIYSASDKNLWRGFYAKELSIMLPKGIENTKSTNKRVQFGAKDLILDSQGVSGSFFGENVLKVGEGSAGKWAFTISDLSLSLSMNSLTGGAIAGDIAVPIFEKPMDYSGYIAQNNYGLKVGINSDYKTPVFLGEMKLDKNSSVSIDVEDGTVYPSANLSGELSIAGKIGQKAGETSSSVKTDSLSSKGFHFPGIVFENLKLETAPGKKPISAKSFGFKGEMKLMNFPATVENLKLVTPSNQAGLSFDLKINLDGEGSHATTSMQVMGKLEDGNKIQQWKFDKVAVNGIKIDYEKGGITLEGGLEIMEDHSWYGDGFRGDITATIKSIDLKVKGKAIFGVKDFRYWNVDVWTTNEDKSSNKFLINSMVGGITYRMKKVRGNDDNFSPSSTVYRPNSEYGLGVRAGVDISTQNSDTFSGKAFLELEFNSHGGLNKIGFTGEGAFMGDNTKGGLDTKEFGGLNETLDKVENFIEKNKEKAEEISKNGNFMALAKASIPVHDVAASGKVGVYVGIEKDFVNQSFDGEFELYLDLNAIKGGGENNLAGYAKMHVDPKDWYIYIGTPQKRIELLFQVGVQMRVGGYFMTGTVLPSPSDLSPHPTVTKILGDDMLRGERKENQLQAGKGFAFGMNFGYGYAYNYGIFYANVELGAGFDVMHAYYPNAKCVGRPGPVGNNGWYSMGQVYAYLYGEFGVKVNLAFIKGNFVIAEAGVAAMLRGQFPNPVYIQGYVGMYYKILGGLVSGRMRMKVEVGEECVLDNINNAVGVPMISDLTPKDKSDDVSVFTAPQAVFNYAVNSDFTVAMEDKTRTFKIQLKNFLVTSQGSEIKGTLEWNDTHDAVTFNPERPLPSEKEVNVVVEVSFDEKIKGVYQTMKENGKPVTERLEATFVTDKAPDHIVWENIAYMYPVTNQKNFYPEEYKIGYIKMNKPQDYLFDKGFEIKAEFVSKITGQGERTKVSYDQNKGMVFFDIPDMILDTDYSLNLMVFPPGQDIPTEIIVEETEILEDQEAGDTSWYDPNTDTQSIKNTNASTVISNKKAANVTLSNAEPKSIFEYTFKTSRHATFGEKIRDLNVANNIANYIHSDVQSLSIEVANYEYLEELEITGGPYTGSHPLIYAQAILDDNYYKKTIYPLIYKNYPLDSTIVVNRDSEILGVPPIRSFYVGNEYTSNLKNNPNSHWVRNRIPFVYNLPYQYKSDFIYLRNRVANSYSSTNGDQVKYNSFKYIINSSFPPLPLGKYKAQLIYQTPGAMHTKGYTLKYRNE